MLSAVIIHLERKKGGRYFGGLFCYWTLLAITGIFILYSMIRMANTQVSYLMADHLLIIVQVFVFRQQISFVDVINYFSKWLSQKLSN